MFHRFSNDILVIQSPGFGLPMLLINRDISTRIHRIGAGLSGDEGEDHIREMVFESIIVLLGNAQHALQAQMDMLTNYMKMQIDSALQIMKTDVNNA